MGRTITYDVHGNDVTCMREFDALKNPCEDCNRKDCDEKGKIIDKIFRLEVDTGSGGYGFTDSFDELLSDVENEYGEKTREEVKEWALHSKKGDKFHKYGMYIWNLDETYKIF